MSVLSMPCVRCGQPGYTSSAGLLCATHGGIPDAAAVEAIVGAGGPSPLWELCTGVFVATGAAYGILQAATVSTLLRADEQGDLRAAAGMVSLTRTGLWAYLTLFLIWFLTVGSVATRLGQDQRVALRHWTVLVWRVALVPTLVFTVLAGDLRPDLEIVFSTAQVLSTALLVAYAAVVWRRLRPEPLPELP